jgi:group I intron endonuclease
VFIYLIENQVNGKKYVGMTKHAVSSRWKGHLADARRGSDRLLCKAVRKYGDQSFSVNAIDIAEIHDQLAYKESFWINHYQCEAPNGYNLTSGGENTVMTDALRDTLSKAATTRWQDPDECKKQAIRTHNFLSDPINAKAQSERIKASFIKNPQLRQNISVTHKELWSDDGYRTRIISKRAEGWQTPVARENASSAAKMRHARGDYKSKQKKVELSDGRVFDSITECAKAIGCSSNSNIRSCAKGDRKSVMGFTVKFIED